MDEITLALILGSERRARVECRSLVEFLETTETAWRVASRARELAIEGEIEVSLTRGNQRICAARTDGQSLLLEVKTRQGRMRFTFERPTVRFKDVNEPSSCDLEAWEDHTPCYVLEIEDEDLRVRIYHDGELRLELKSERGQKKVFPHQSVRS